jgi:hypothetical protein
MSTIIEKDLLWDELGLDTLLTAGSSNKNETALNPAALLLGGSPSFAIESSVPQFQPITQLLSKKSENNELKPLANILQEQEYVELGMKKVMTKHKKMIEKPTYSAIMDRYGSVPHKPKVISKSKLSELADPVLGKLSRAERKEIDRIQKLQEMEERAYHYLPNKKAAPSSSYQSEETEYQQLYEQLERQQKQQVSRSKHPYEKILKEEMSPTKRNRQSTQYGNDEEDDEAGSSYDEGGLFLTASHKNESMNKHQSPSRHPFLSPSHRNGVSTYVSPPRDSESVAAFLERLKSSPHDKIDMNIKSSKNGFASMLRDRINFAQKVDKIVPKNKKIDENDVISAYQRYANMKKEREKQLDIARKAARGKPPKIQPKMTKKTNEAISKRVAGSENIRKSTNSRIVVDPSKKSLPKKKVIPSSGYGKEVKRYSVHPKPPSYSKSKKSSLRTIPGKATSVDNSHHLTEEEELMMSNESLGGSSDDEMMSNTFLTGMIKTNNKPNRRSLADHEPSKAISKVKSRLKHSLQQHQQQDYTLPSIPPTIPEKPTSSSKILGSKSKKSLSSANANRDHLPGLPGAKQNYANDEDGVLVSSASAPSSSRATLRQQLKGSHRSHSTPSIAQTRQKAIKPESRFNQLKAMIEEDNLESSGLMQKAPTNGLNKPQVIDRNGGVVDENNSLNAQNNYGKRRSMNAASTGKLPPAKSGALQIPIMPRSIAAPNDDNKNTSSKGAKTTVDASKSNPSNDDFDIDKELADVDAFLEDMDQAADNSNAPVQESDSVDRNLTDEKEDIQQLISRLKKYENVQLKGTSDLYVKPDTNAHLVKHAEKIGGHFSNIDAMMEKINALKDGLE